MALGMNPLPITSTLNKIVGQTMLSSLFRSTSFEAKIVNSKPKECRLDNLWYCCTILLFSAYPPQKNVAGSTQAFTTTNNSLV